MKKIFFGIYITKNLLIYYLLAALISHEFAIYRANMYTYHNLDNKTPVIKDVLICNYLVSTYLLIQIGTYLCENCTFFNQCTFLDYCQFLYQCKYEPI